MPSETSPIPKALPTNAIFGFSRMILKLVEEKSLLIWPLCWMRKGRHSGTKSSRITRRPDLPCPRIFRFRSLTSKDALEGLNVKVLEREGYEADDVIATLARVGEEKGFGVVVISGDKDFRQILSPRSFSVGHHEGQPSGL
jgi:DNA polymerase I